MEEQARDKLPLAVQAVRKCGMCYGKYLLLTGTDDMAMQIGILAKQMGAACVAAAVKGAEEKRYVERCGFFALPQDEGNPEALLKEATQGRRFDAVCETTGTPQAYELAFRAAKRGACVALMKPLEEPLFFHVCDVIRDQLHFMGIMSADAESEKTAEALRENGALRELLAQVGA